MTSNDIIAQKSRSSLHGKKMLMALFKKRNEDLFIN